MNKENNKKKVILMIIGVIVLMLVVAGATYAYFQAQVGKGDSVQINAKAGTTDSLSFNINDIDVSDDANKILDENANDANIIVNANQSNFGPNGNSIGDGVKLNAHLIAGDDDNEAHYEYYVYLNISANNLEYTTPESTPELVLVVQDPTNGYIDEIKGLEKDEITLGEKSVPCFDITKASGIITIASKYKIDATSETQGEEDQNWQVSVIFKNLETDQHLNTNKSFQANLSIQSESINYLDLASYAECNEHRCTYTDYRSREYKYQIKNVYFVNRIAEDDELNSVAKWDLSSSKDGSIMGWLKANEDENTPYDLYIGSKEKIKVRSFAHAFQNLSNVENIDLNPSILDTSNLTDTSFMFSDTSKLTAITGIENLNVSNVTNMSNMFSLSNISSLDLSNWDTHKVEDMSHIFEGMTNLTEIIGIEDLDVSNVIDMSYMFAPFWNLVEYKRVPLTKLDLSNWNVENVENMSHIFESLNLDELNISNWKTSKVTNMSYMFAGAIGEFTSCDSLFDNLIGLEDLNVSNVTNMSGMFLGNSGTTTLNLSNWHVDNVQDMSKMFMSSGIKTLNISNWNTHNVTNMSGMFGSCITDGGYNYTSITNIVGLEILDVSNVTDMSEMFSSARGLTTLDLSKWNTHNVTDMSEMFDDDTNLTTLKVNNWDFSGMKLYDGSSGPFNRIFAYTYNLQTIEGIENWDVSEVTNMSGMFYGVRVTSLDLSQWDTHNVTDMSSMFHEAGKLTSIDMRKATFSQVTSYNSMFYNTSSTLKVTITGEENRNWFINSINNDSGYYGFDLTEDQLNVLPELR